MYDFLRDLLSRDEFPVVEQFVTPSRPACHAPIPRFLFNTRIGIHLDKVSKEADWDGPLWTHQAQALDELGRGNNVVLSTGTASGKSLVFRTLAFHKALLKPDSRILVFYPLKALAADQIRGWWEMARSLGLSEEIIGRIDGSVRVKDRDEVLKSARILVMTPDVCHAWFMSRLSQPTISNFLRGLSTLVMDEAHTLEGVFGSNFAFLIRRLTAARNNLLQDEIEAQPLQLIAATATIKNPGEHLSQLTGSEFSVVDHDADGSQQFERLIAHIASEAGTEFDTAKAMHKRLLHGGRQGGFITFLDSRKGVEGLAMASGDENRSQEFGELLADAAVLPYRAGYDVMDRQQIERRLQSGSLRGIVSTSALELGIDIPHLRVGLNIGVPGTRKAYRQRLGRVGRNGPGVFVVIAPHHAFSGYGTTFREYHDMSVEPSYLYVDNRFMQFAHGRCLAVELESLGGSQNTPRDVVWPNGFADMHAAARPGGNRLPEYDAIAALGGDTPHYGYPLRNVGEVTFQIKRQSDGDSFGDVSQLQALRECYPGATYLHLARGYEVTAWHTSSFEPFVRVKPTVPGRLTRPRIRTWIHAGITSSDLLEDSFMRGENGFLAECQMQITERVEGYDDSLTGRFRAYTELQQRNPNMRARSRNFRTSGVILRIASDWFKPVAIRRLFAHRLREVFVREYSISPRDVGSETSGISMRDLDGSGLVGGCIAIYDETYGSLRLTEQLYLNFAHILTRLSAAVAADSIDGDDDIANIVTAIQEEVSGFTDIGAIHDAREDRPTGHEQVFAEGSVVCYRQSGQMAIDVAIVQPTIMDGHLRYQVEGPGRPGQAPVKRWISASSIEPSAIADAWEYAWWNRETERYEEPPNNE